MSSLLEGVSKIYVSIFQCRVLEVEPKGSTEFKRKDTYEEVYYLCWNAKPDGVYVNGILFKGNKDTCYDDSDPYMNNRTFSLYNGEDYISFEKTESNDIAIYFEDNNPMQRNNMVEGITNGSDEIRSIEIINKGQVVVSMTEDNLELSIGRYYVNNQGKFNALDNYIGSVIQSCQLKE